MKVQKWVQSDRVQEVLLLSVVTFFWFSQYVYVPYQAAYLASIGVLPSVVGIVVGAYGFSQFALRLPVGLMADRKGRHKPFILLGVVASGCASLFRIFLPNEIGFLTASLFSGLAAAMWISFMVLFFTYFPKGKLQNASGLIVGANNFGILAGFVTGTLLYQHHGMKLLCELGFAAALPAFLLALCIREQRQEFEPFSVKQLVTVYADRRLIVFSLLALIQQGVQMSTSMSFVTQAAQARGATSLQIGICSIIYILAAVLSSYYAASKSAQKRGARFWIPAILVCLVLYCVLIPNLPSVEWIYVAQILSGLSTGVLFSFCNSEAMQSVPEGKRSTAMGFFQAVYAVGMTTFPVLTGAVTGAFSLRSAFYGLAGVAAVGLTGALLYYRAAGNAKEKGAQSGRSSNQKKLPS